MMDLDSLPPMCIESANAAAERKFAREVYEYAAILSINMEDKESFQRYIASLRPYYTTMKRYCLLVSSICSPALGFFVWPPFSSVFMV